MAIDYKQCNAFLADYLLNISRGGTFVRSEDPLPVGSELLFRFRVPGLDETLELLGKVVWINSPVHREREDIPESGMGVRFLYRDHDHRQRFESTIANILAERFGERLARELLAARDRIHHKGIALAPLD